MELSGLLAVLVFTSIFAGIYALLSLGLNLQWGVTGLFNAGIAGFYALGAYTSAILTMAPAPGRTGGWQWPMPLGMLGAMVTSGLLAYGLGRLTLRLREAMVETASALADHPVDRPGRLYGQRTPDTRPLGSCPQGHP